jgi:hypothetical protein
MKCNILKKKDDTKLFSWLLHAILAIVISGWLLFREHYRKPLKFLLFQHLQTFVTTTLHCLYKMTTPFWEEKDFPLLFSLLWHTINLSPFVNHHMKSLNELATFYKRAINNITTIGDCLKTHQKLLGKTRTQKGWHKERDKKKLRGIYMHMHIHINVQVSNMKPNYKIILEVEKTLSKRGTTTTF